MAKTTTIRVGKTKYERLARISRETGRSLADVISDATDALERERFAASVRVELDQLRRDPVAWADYLAGFELAVSDGVAY